MLPFCACGERDYTAPYPKNDSLSLLQGAASPVAARFTQRWRRTSASGPFLPGRGLGGTGFDPKQFSPSCRAAASLAQRLSGEFAEHRWTAERPKVSGDLVRMASAMSE
jgi:hypothetical protein